MTLFENANGGWTIELHFAQAPELATLRPLVSGIAGAQVADSLSLRCVQPRDWVAASLQGLKPVRAGRFLVHGAHDRGRTPASGVAIEIEAALAFGTGHHATTRGCLLALHELLKRRRPRRVLDLGTGTGVLAIAAARTLRQKVRASDIDAQAVRLARANARANRAGPHVRAIHAAGLPAAEIRNGAPYDLVFANILLPPLQRLAAPLARRLTPGATVVLSGLLTKQASAALAAYRLQQLYLAKRIDLEGWTTLLLRRAPICRRRRRPERSATPRRPTARHR